MASRRQATSSSTFMGRNTQLPRKTKQGVLTPIVLHSRIQLSATGFSYNWLMATIGGMNCDYPKLPVTMWPCDHEAKSPGENLPYLHGYFSGTSIWSIILSHAHSYRIPVSQSQSWSQVVLLGVTTPWRLPWCINCQSDVIQSTWLSPGSDTDQMTMFQLLCAGIHQVNAWQNNGITRLTLV